MSCPSKFEMLPTSLSFLIARVRSPTTSTNWQFIRTPCSLHPTSPLINGLESLFRTASTLFHVLTFMTTYQCILVTTHLEHPFTQIYKKAPAPWASTRFNLKSNQPQCIDELAWLSLHQRPRITVNSELTVFTVSFWEDKVKGATPSKVHYLPNILPD